MDQGAGKGPRCRAVIPLSSDDDETYSSRGGEGIKKKFHLPALGGKKRKAAPEGETRASKKGKVSLPDYSATAAHSEEGWLPRGKPPVRSYVSALHHNFTL